MNTARCLKIIHLAAFEGNLGDWINHNGFYGNFKTFVHSDFSVTQVNIREFYNNCEKKFDSDFSAYINTFDFFLIGGGRYFDAQWDYSDTGTTMNFSEEFLESIKIPVVVNAMGFCYYDTTTPEVLIKCRYFIENISNRSNWFLSIRNDGSEKRLIKCYGPEIMKKIIKTPDNGFFYIPSLQPFQFTKKMYTIGFTLTDDLFSRSYNRNVDSDLFFENISKLIGELHASGVRIMLFLHTPQDINTLHKLFIRIGANPFRENIIIAPYNPTDNAGAEQIVSYYRACDLLIAMRFHANIIAISNSVPTIGLAGHQRIQSLFEDLGLSRYCVPVDTPDFAEMLKKIINELETEQGKSNYFNSTKKQVKSLNNSMINYMTHLKEFLQIVL